MTTFSVSLSASQWLLVALLATACRTGRPYPDPSAPRHAGSGPRWPAPAAGDTIRVVSFNIEFAERIDAAIALLTTDPALRDAGIVLLQEMDADGTRRVAEALRMSWVYYPALLHKRTRRDFGNAVLSRWPIVEDAKLVLPHPSWYAGTHRIATAATVQAGDAPLRVYSTHLGTPLDVNDHGRREQLRAILADAARHGRVIIGGDMNTSRVGTVARDAGYTWPTSGIGRTTRFGRWDHVFVRGLAMPPTESAGVVARGKGISDHHPVWVRVIRD